MTRASPQYIADLQAKRWRGESLTPEEQQAWGSAEKDRFFYLREAQRQAERTPMQAYQAQLPFIKQAGEEYRLGATEAARELRPYSQAGGRALSRIEELIRAAPSFTGPTQAELEASPAYQFRMQQAQLARERGAAARGGLFSGAHQKDLARYMQGLASQEYGAEYERRRQQALLEEEQRQANIRAMSGIGEMGYSASTGLGNLRAGLHESLARLRLGTGAAKAGAIQAAGQARASGAQQAMAFSDARRAEKAAKGSKWGTIGKIGGTIGGGLAGWALSGGNPMGAMAGASMGSQMMGGGSYQIPSYGGSGAGIGGATTQPYMAYQPYSGGFIPNY